MRAHNAGTILLCLVAMAVLRCDTRSWRPGDLTTKPTALVVLRGVGSVDYRVSDTMQSMRYELSVPYPAADQLIELASRVAATGFRPLREHPMNPGLPSSFVRGWGDFVDGRKSPELRVYQWMGDWVGPEGEWLEYVLTYSYPEGSTPMLHTLRVDAVLIPADAARASIVDAAGEDHYQKVGTLKLPSDTPPAVLLPPPSGSREGGVTPLSFVDENP